MLACYKLRSLTWFDWHLPSSAGCSLRLVISLLFHSLLFAGCLFFRMTHFVLSAFSRVINIRWFIWLLFLLPVGTRRAAFSPTSWTSTVRNLRLRFLTAVGFLCSRSPSYLHGECYIPLDCATVRIWGSVMHHYTWVAGHNFNVDTIYWYCNRLW